MAAADNPKRRLWKETFCPLCLGFFADPVMLDCGHNFCKGCILLFWEEPNVLPSVCPQCQENLPQKTLRPNTKLGVIVDIVKQLNDQLRKDTMEWGVCESHQEPLMLFCKDDGAPICLVCHRSGRHKEHRVVLAEAAVEESKAQVGTCLQNLRKTKEEVLASKGNVKNHSQDLINAIIRERQRTVTSFRDLREFLVEEENRLLAQMEEVEKEIAQKKDEDIDRLSEALPSLENTIREMEEARDKPARELLKDMRSMMQRCEQQKKKFEIPESFLLALEWRIWNFREINPVIMNASSKFKDTLKSAYPQPQEDDPGSRNGSSSSARLLSTGNV